MSSISEQGSHASSSYVTFSQKPKSRSVLQYSMHPQVPIWHISHTPWLRHFHARLRPFGALHRRHRSDSHISTPPRETAGTFSRANMDQVRSRPRRTIATLALFQVPLPVKRGLPEQIPALRLCHGAFISHFGYIKVTSRRNRPRFLTRS